MRIGVALFDQAEELDWAGPLEVLAMWAKGWPEDHVEVFTVAESPAPITCAKDLRVLADATWADAGPIDVLVCPGGLGTLGQLGQEASAGIDMALYLVTRLHSAGRAREMARDIEYERSVATPT
jgi:transcriptional regulator GlxA family with amidase domain